MSRHKCSTQHCKNTGKRARGAADIAGLAARVNSRSRRPIFKPSYYCEACVAAAGQRSLSSSVSETARRRNDERS